MQGILCFGDSITFGVGETPGKGWCGRLKDFYEPKGFHKGVFNLGVPGHDSNNLLARFDAECKTRIRLKRPTDKFTILIAIGTNDCKWEGMPEDNQPHISEEQFRENIQELVAKARSYKAKLAFIGIPPVDESLTLPFEETAFKNERVKIYNDIIKDCCAEEEVLFLDMFSMMIEQTYPDMLTDGVHPNSKGYDFMFQRILTFLETNDMLP